MFKKFINLLTSYCVDNLTGKRNYKNISIILTTVFVIYLTVFSEYGVLYKYVQIWTNPNINSLENVPNLFFFGNFIYLSIMFEFSKMVLVDVIYGVFNALFDDDFKHIDYAYYNMNLLWERRTDSSLKYFYAQLFAKNNFLFAVFKGHFWNNHYLVIFMRFKNLPLFFYFSFLFIISTISSLFLLSYYGFYGVFILNFITLIMFWLSTIPYFDRFFIDSITYKIDLGKWFKINFHQTVNFEICIDPIAFSFMFLTITIAVFVYMYAFSYFRYEPNVERLIILINCFVISMICLVTSGNIFVMFLGWELIGLTSFFLINFWSTRMSTLKSAFKAFVFNKFSDVSILISILIIFFCFNDTNLITINNQISYYNNFYIIALHYQISILELLSFFFTTSAFVKSAQFGFHTWLPDSMEAPVPASALIHSATLVSAGVFLLLKFSPLFEYSIYSYYVIPIIGSFTAFFGGLCSAYQSDIKKILAYSTISHCGFLMVCFSTYITEYTILYLYIHGFFKAAVFLCVGNIIRFSRNYQDFRRMGMFWKYLPFECLSSFICLINLCGIPFSLGYYIKHLLLVGVHMNTYFLSFILLNILGGAVFGLIYSYRLFYFVFFDFKKAKKIIYNQSNRSNLFSEHYTNTTLASNLAISGLIISAYIICIYIFNIFLNKSSYGEGLDIYSLRPSQYSEFDHPILTTINNIGYFNWLLLIIIISILSFSWRRVHNNHNVIDIFFSTVTFIIFFFVFYSILT